MGLGLAARLPEIDQPIVRFHPTRHYRSAVLARACYADHAAGVPEWAKRVAQANREMQQAGELPIMEWLACGAYLVSGGENVAIPRIAAVLIWVSGAIPVWLLARRLAGDLAAPLAAALFLFLPYGIVASRNFQPDPLMTVTSLWALHALVRHHDHPSRSHFVTAAALIGAAGLVKPMSVFVTVPAALVLETRLTLHLRTMVRAAALLAAGLAAPALYYGYSAVAGSLVRDQMRMRFEPHLLSSTFFWGGMTDMVSRVHTIPMFVIAAGAMLVAPDRLTRRVLAALFAGYLAFAVVFTYHMPTHDYYHLPYLPIVAIGVAAFAARFAARVPAWGVYLVCAMVAVAGVLRALPRLQVDDAAVYAQIYEEIGALAEHEVKALFLDTEYGFALMYHAQISGDSWPNQDDLAAEAIDGRVAIDAETRFLRDYADWQPTHFIVTDLASFDASPDLHRLLDRRATPIRITDRYRVYRFTR